MRRYLLFATEFYALPILRPLQRAALQQGAEVAWLAPPALARRLQSDERRLATRAAVRDFAADAVFSAVNWVPPALEGFKVQVFHGFNADKRHPARGHFRIRGFFDLYCTQGPDTTGPFQALARKHGHFAVAETGWPKLDPLFSPSGRSRCSSLRPDDDRPVILYASTFTEGLTSAPKLFDTIAEQIARGDRYWLLTLHPKSDPVWVRRYRGLAGENARYLEADRMLDMLGAADVLLSDTSSVISEFLVQRRPVVTFRNRAPRAHMLDVREPGDVEAALRAALAPTPSLMHVIEDYARHIHPYRDGHSSERVLAAVEQMLRQPPALPKSKPRNLWRRWRLREQMHALFRP